MKAFGIAKSKENSNMNLPPDYSGRKVHVAYGVVIALDKFIDFSVSYTDRVNRRRTADFFIYLTPREESIAITA